MLLVATLVVAGLTALIGALVIARNTRSELNQALFIHSLFISAWMVANYYSNQLSFSNDRLLIINHLVFVFATGTVGYLPVFLSNLVNDRFSRRARVVIELSVVLFAVLSATPLIVQDIKPTEPVVEIVFGPLSPAYFLAIITYVVLAVVIYVRGRRSKSLTATTRGRLRVAGLASIVALSLSVFFNAVLPFFVGSFTASRIGPLALGLLVAGFGYSIILQRLFDIRLFAVRAFAYAVTLALIAGIYAALLFGFAALSSGVELSSAAILASALYVVFAIATIQPLKNFLDGVSRKLFYRNNYRSQDIQTKLSDHYISSTSIRKLAEGTKTILQDALHVDFAKLIPAEKLASRNNAALNGIVTDNKLDSQPETIVITDDLPQEALKNQLTQENIGLLMRIQNNKSVSGWLALGGKKSGAPFYGKDIDLLHLSSKNLALAITNLQKFETAAQFNKRLEREIKEATQELRKTNGLLHKANKSKDNFISMTSHQVLPQLTAAKGFVTMLQEGVEGKVNKGQSELLGLTEEGVDRTVSIVRDMLDLSKMAAGRLVLDISSANLTQIVKDETSRMQGKADQREIILTVTAKKVPNFDFDRNKVLEVVTNFISNAIQYSPDNSVITVQLASTKDAVEFTVADQGIGVPKQSQKKLFTKFYRSKNAKQARPSGTGVGLYFAKQVISAHNGEVFYKPNPKGGSIFGFKIPLKRTAKKKKV